MPDTGVFVTSSMGLWGGYDYPKWCNFIFVFLYRYIRCVFLSDHKIMGYPTTFIF